MGLFKLFNLYEWVLPNQVQYLARYKDNESLYKKTRDLWTDLNSASMYFLIIAIVVAILAAWYYYYRYNKRPGRKYRVSHWAGWIGITAGVTIILTMVVGYVMVSLTLKEQVGFILMISLINGLYASAMYFILSFVFCNLPFSTNAYRFLKIGK